MAALARGALISICALLAACGGSGGGGGGGSSPPPQPPTPTTFTVSATVTGLDADGLVLQNNSGSDVSVAGNGTVTFPGQAPTGTAFAVTVKTQPTIGPFPLPAQFCTVTNGSGTVGNSAVNVAIACAAPVNRYLYVGNRNGNDVSGYSVNARTGELTAVPGSPFAAGVQPYFLTPEPTGRFAYVTNQGNASVPPRVSAYTVDAATGVLTQIAGSPFDLSATPQPPGATFVNPPILFAHRSGAFGYALGTLNSVFESRLFGATINALTGALTEINGFPLDLDFSTGGPIQDSSGRMAVLATQTTQFGPNAELRTFMIHSPSGTLMPFSTFPTVNAQLSSAFITPGDNFVLTASRTAGTIEVFAIDKQAGIPTGVLRAVGAPVPTAPRPFGIAYNRRNDVFYVSHLGLTGVEPPLVSTFRLDQNTGGVTAIGAPIASNGAGNFGATLHPSGRFLLQYNASPSSLQIYTIDPTTFAPTLQPNPVPLPRFPFFDFSGKYLYATDGATDTVSSYRFDTATGAITLVNTLPTGLTAAPFVSTFGFQPQ